MSDTGAKAREFSTRGAGVHFNFDIDTIETLLGLGASEIKPNPDKMLPQNS